MAIHLLGDIHIRGDMDGNQWSVNSILLLKFIDSMNIKPGDTVIQLGDVFNKHLNYGKTNRAALKVFNYLSTKCKQIIIVEGNHGRSLQEGANTECLKEIINLTVIEDMAVIPVDGVNILFLPSKEGIPYGPKYEELIRKLEVKKVDLVLGHGMIKETKMFDAGFLNLDNIGVEFKHAIMGDVHIPSATGNRYSIGSLWACTVAEANYDRGYMVYDKDELKIIPIPKDTFCEFEFLTYPDIAFKKDRNFKVVTVSCSKENKPLIEKEIRTAIKNNLYEIKWSFTEDSKDVTILNSSEGSLEEQFFKDNAFSKDVIELCTFYLKQE